ncbi:MAG: hypothetical protein HRT35_27000 [Algicola sp.]|nr:hypothetical protein [Algicola sp.]
MKTTTYRKLSFLNMLSALFRGLAQILKLWPILLVVGCYFAPVSPHLRWEYTYRDQGHVRIYGACQYIGIHGLRSYMRGQQCPVIALIQRP